ncbi:hypothetical protein HFO93_25365 [Rhizobium leguminosarum]|uniref:hypothetical protein n=1 Tax=Rhizobium TaxID=379 RepID=UPI000366ABDD|nr:MULTISPECIES: hypothetical protein [Rhizobium]MBY5405112.1 hypothetical protein [Rhizobium leguminosarum]MBY5446735.1 hypothetical protein [Rhizobium leguminosarum]NDK51941.1 hypothetical protein [Rhizobium laguerreae]UWM80237.1 hypothetical protein N2A41_16160 [Rhizobium leguminosarum bv. viciae]UWU26999.1 hypothetical protein N2600_16605 [Rhizobium leguminosarum bv. viciae]
MPRLISFMLTRIAAGAGLGCVVGLVVWSNGFAGISSASSTDYYIAQGMFVYLFASTLGVGYLATALMLDDTR